jgi:hypothetical protein
MHTELLVRVLEVLPHGLRGDAESVCDLAVRAAVGDQGDHLSLPRRQSHWGRARTQKLPEVRQQEIERTSVTFAEVGVRAIELEARVTRARVQVELQDELDAERTIAVLVELAASVLTE